MKKYHNKRPIRSLHPNPCHWTRKPRSNSWRQKVAYDSEEEAEEYLQQNPKLKAIGYRVYQCVICCKWHVGRIH